MNRRSTFPDWTADSRFSSPSFNRDGRGRKSAISRKGEFKLDYVVDRSGGASGTASGGMVPSTGGGPGNPTGGGRMAVIGVTRNVRLRRRGASGFGFSLRGGREYAAGFYVSDVQPGSEAHRNGLRVNSRLLTRILTVLTRIDLLIERTMRFTFSSFVLFVPLSGRRSDHKGERVSGRGRCPSGSRASGKKPASARSQDSK